ncbi:BON domain-containing protein [Neorhizobium sp. BT27B]|uniref:BON domain-containing protein n=1 Tax=Neorhizobium sp. BT27B TaxID=3142625 RepID=UPI003D2721A0
MFLNTFNAGAAFSFSREPGTSCGKPAIEAELRYLENVNCSDVRVEESGSFIVLDGSVPSSRELAKIVRLANEIAGSDNIICQMIVVPSNKSEVPFMLA